MIEITDNHIEEVEQKFGVSFDDESKEFIKCLESKDIQACPGAGKTTSLVAKLDIIAGQMPFNNNSGVLVLTHTNVAVDEIKHKLGVNAKTLLSYPNHVGTFQSFVNKFLAIPMYIQLFGKRPERIDNEMFYKVFQEKFDSINDFHKNWLLQRAEEKYTNVLNFIENFEVSLHEIRYNEKNIITSQSKMFSAIKTISKLPMKTRQSGYLTYYYCYELALEYLDTFPEIVEVFQKRFQYVFIDEVQDTDDKQFEILDRLFSNSNVVVQRIGDKNQEIFSSLNSNASGWEIADDFLEIKNTKRLSKQNSDKVTYFAISPQELNGNDAVDIQPVILLYGENDIGEPIFEKFATLIIENGLQNIKDAKFKAVGAVGKVHEKELTIPSYFPTFSKDDNRTLEYDTILDKMNLFNKKEILTKNYQKVLLSVILEYLKYENIKQNDSYFTQRTLLKFLREQNKDAYNDFKLKLFNAVKNLNENECVIEVLQDKIQIVLDFFGEQVNESVLETIIQNYKIDFSIKTSKNKYRYINDDIEFDIDISTIHKAKGETHTATLVLETFNRTYDLKQLIKLLKGKKFNQKTIEPKKKLLYVAMSRPTHLLCLAMSKNHVEDKDIPELEANGFSVQDIE